MKLLCGDVLEMLKTLPDESVQCCVTSPPYYGLRDYGTAKWEGGDEGCNHKKELQPRNERPLGLFHSGSDENNASREMNYSSICGKCGAIRIDSQIGLESTPDDYVKKLVEVFREVRRVLRKDGVLFLNLGDSYAGSGKGDNPNGKQGTNTGTRFDSPTSGYTPNGLKPKDLIGIPWRVAFALQSDGWWLRQDIIWAKPNPMPESVKDRCTKSHEYIFLLTKSASYYYDAEAIKEPSAYPEDDRGSRVMEEHKRFPTDKVNGIRASGVYPTRNQRSVWTITTKPFKGAHFAVFPPEIPERCIKAGSRVGDIVIDPFNGSGTTGVMAKSLGRDYIGIDLNPEYIEMAQKRIDKVVYQPKLAVEI